MEEGKTFPRTQKILYYTCLQWKVNGKLQQNNIGMTIIGTHPFRMKVWVTIQPTWLVRANGI